MRPISRVLLGGGAVLIALAGSGCKMKVEASITGYKPGEASVILVHVKAKPGTRVVCSPACYECDPTEIPASGEADIEVKLDGTNASKSLKEVCLRAKKGVFKGEADLKLESALPPKIEIYGNGLFSTAQPESNGAIELLPEPAANLSAKAGTILEVGGKKLTTDEHDYATGPITLSLDTPVKDLTLGKLCADDASSLGSAPISITFAGGAKASIDYPLTSEAARRSANAVLAKVKDGPVLFSWENSGAKRPARGRRAALYMYGDSCAAAGADTATLSELTVVLTGESKERTGTCDYALTEEKTGAGRGTSSGKLTYHDVEATAYDRFTGKKLGSKLFEAPKECTSDLKLSSVNSTIQDQDTYVAKASIATWGASLAK